MITVGIVIYDSIDQISGGYLYDRMLRDQVKASGHTVEIFDLPGGRYLTRPVSGGTARLISMLDSRGPVDVLIVDELCHPSIHPRTLRKRIGETILIGLIHHLKKDEYNPFWLRSRITALEKRFLDSMDAFIFNSTSTRDQVRELSPGDKPSVIAIPSGSKFAGSDRIVRVDAPPFKLLFVGNVISRKGLHTVLDAISLLPRRNDVELTVVGSPEVDPGYYRRIRRDVVRLGIEDNVMFAGSIDDQELENLYLQNHVFCVPSQFEGFGIVYLEAMGFGLPAIASNAGGAADIIQDGVNGYLINPEAPRELADRLSALMEDQGKLEEMSVAARARFVNAATWQDSMSEIESFIAAMID